MPASEEISIGTARYTREIQMREDGTLEAIYRFDSGKQRLSAAEYETMRAGLGKHAARVPEVITFGSEASELTALGKIGGALKLVRENAAKDSDNPVDQVRLARMLVAAGAVDSAVAIARKITGKAPDLCQGWQALSLAYQHDSFGRRFQGNWNRAEAERCYREALKLNSEDVGALWPHRCCGNVL